MNTPYFDLEYIHRSADQSTVRFAAYQSAERILDERYRIIRNYIKKNDVIYTEIMLPKNAPKEYLDRGTLWNSVEKSEKRKDARLGIRMIASLPCKLSKDQNISLVREYVRRMFVNEGMIADVSVHNPVKTDENGNMIKDYNPHTHVMLTIRPIDENGHWMNKTKREFVIDENGNKVVLKSGKYKKNKVTAYELTSDYLIRIRKEWEIITNRYLRENGIDDRIDMSGMFKDEDMAPRVYLNIREYNFEKSGLGTTSAGKLAQKVAEHNEQVKNIKSVIFWLTLMIESIKIRKNTLTSGKEQSILAMHLIKQCITLLKSDPDISELDLSTDAKNMTKHENFSTVISYMVENSDDIYDLESVKKKKDTLDQKYRELYIQHYNFNITDKKYKNLIPLFECREKYTEIYKRYTNISFKRRRERFKKEYINEINEYEKNDKSIKESLSGADVSFSKFRQMIDQNNERLKTTEEMIENINNEIKMYNEIIYFNDLFKGRSIEQTRHPDKKSPDSYVQKRINDITSLSETSDLQSAGIDVLIDEKGNDKNNDKTRIHTSPSIEI